MEQGNWAPEHSDALRNLVGRGMSFSEIAATINATFGTSYSRNAAIGRAKRMGIAGPARPEPSAPRTPRPGRQHEPGPAEAGSPRFPWPTPRFEEGEPVKLRCVAVEPRHLALVELERGDCRYPYGGDAEGEAITFCGHPRRPGSSYCTPHFLLSRNPVLVGERLANSVALRSVEAA